MAAPFHAGERAVQARAGVRAAAARVGEIIGLVVPPHAREFLTRQQLALVATTDSQGRVWASLLTGDPGMLRLLDPQTLHIAATPVAPDPLVDALASADGRAVNVGVLLIDLATRRRLRVNGTAEVAREGGVVVHVQRAHWICPKYIQQRGILGLGSPAPAPERGACAPVAAATLTRGQREWIASADTFFIASAHPTDGADASHRGGSPGFVRLARGPAGEDVLTFPDYPGDNMFNTFGNLAVNPRAGLLFVDFDRGSTLQLTGSAEVLWTRAEFAVFPGAERAVRFRVTETLESPCATTVRWRLVERSPFNPPAPPVPRRPLVDVVPGR